MCKRPADPGAQAGYRSTNGAHWQGPRITRQQGSLLSLHLTNSCWMSTLGMNVQRGARAGTRGGRAVSARQRRAAEETGDQARHDARLEDASARRADEGRWIAARGWGSRSQAVSPPFPNGATRPSRGWALRPCDGAGTQGTETSQYLEEVQHRPE